MCNLDVIQTSIDENYLTKTTTTSMKVGLNGILKINSSNLENIISTSRMVIMMDYVRNRPRKIILDTACSNCNANLHKNKETQLLSEIVFGNFSLSSKANGFKLHIIKNPSKMIVSKLFKTPFNSIYYDNKSTSRKISPDSGHNNSSSSNSSCNSNMSGYSSFNSLNSSMTNQITSSIYDKTVKSSSPVNCRPNSSYSNLNSVTSNSNGINKMTNGYFFNETFDIYQKSSIMMSVIFNFNVPEENRAEFEEFIFHYYVLLESILNRISGLISDNSYNIYNGNIVNCWKQSKKWLISLLPRHIPEIYNDSIQNSSVKTKNISKNMINVKIFEDVIEYFDKQKKLPFLTQVITGVLLANQNSALKFFNDLMVQHTSEVFPYKHILQNLGINTNNQTFKRIIVKGMVKEKDQDQVSSWKNKLSSSLKYYKKFLNHTTSDKRNSCSQLEISIIPSTNYVPSENSDGFLNVTYKDVELLTEFIAYLIRPVSTIAYQLYILPTDNVVNDAKIIKFGDNTTVVEIPLINDGMILDKEILPQINELFYPNKIIDHILPSITPLQGLIDINNQLSHGKLFDQIFTESQQSKITYNDKIFNPEFLIIDTDSTSVNIRDTQIVSSSWVGKLLTDLSKLTKLVDYCSAMGNIYLISALNDFSTKAKILKDYRLHKQSTSFDPWLMSKYSLCDSDLDLLSMNN